MCAGEIDKLKELLNTLEIFSNDNPEWALKVVGDMDSLMSETKKKIQAKQTNQPKIGLIEADGFTKQEI